MPAAAVPCEVKGCGTLTRSELRVCRSNPPCEAERVRRHRIVKKLGGYIPDEFPVRTEPLLCGTCGVNYTLSEYGVCQANPECKAVHLRLYLADADNRDANRAWQRQRRVDKADAVHAWFRQRYARDSDVINARKRQRRLENGDAIRAQERARMGRPDRPCRYAKQGCERSAVPNSRFCDVHHREASRRQHQRKRARVREKMAIAQDYVCGWCGKELPGNLKGCAEDHIIPINIGIAIEDPWNKQLLHSRCNLQKAAQITPQAVELALERGIDLGDHYVVVIPPAAKPESAAGARS